MKKQADMALLLMVLVLLSASLGVLHGRKVIGSQPDANAPAISLEHQDAMEYVQPYLMSGNIDAAASILHQFTDPILFKTLDAILADEITTLALDQKIKLLSSALLYDQDLHHQQEILNRMYKYFKREPVYVMMLPEYARAIPMLRAWGKRTNQKNVMDHWKLLSLQKAIDQNDPELLVELFRAGVKPSVKLASEMLYQAVSENKSRSFVPIFVEQLRADINYSPDKKHTALIRAVMNNNRKMVKTLIDNGADPDFVLNSQVGSARQIAFQLGHTRMELLFK